MEKMKTIRYVRLSKCCKYDADTKFQVGILYFEVKLK